MLLFDRLNQARKNIKLKKESSAVEHPDFEEDSFIDVCSNPSEYGLSGTPEIPQDPVCLVDIDSEDPSIFNSVSNHNNEMIHKRCEAEEQFTTDPSAIIYFPDYNIKEEHVQEGDHVITKRTCLGVIDPNTGKTISIEDAKKPGGIIDSWNKHLESMKKTFVENNNTTTTETPTFSEPTCTEVPKFTEETTTEDTSGKTLSNVEYFLEKYANGDDILQVLRKDLMKVLSDMQWIKESGNENEQFSLDFADALNTISVSI